MTWKTFFPVSKKEEAAVLVTTIIPPEKRSFDHDFVTLKEKAYRMASPRFWENET